jgi:hypothetical protein
MPAYLTEHRPARSQWFHRRNRPLTGCTLLHSTESMFDAMGADTGAENVAKFIQGRGTPGSYHDLVDSDSRVYLVDYEHGAFHDGTGSNHWALALAFAVRTIDWARMDPRKRAAILANGAEAFVDQQLYRRRIGAPLTRLRYISKAESDAGQSGFCCHGWRDPGRRSDPGTVAPNLFPFDAWLDACRVALTLRMPDHPDAATLEDEMNAEQYATLKNVEKILAGLQNAVSDPERGVHRLTADVHRKHTARLDATKDRPGPAEDDLYGHVLSMRAEMAATRATLDGLAGAIGGDDLKEHISTEVTRAMETIRDRLADGYGLKLEPKERPDAGKV